MNIETSLMNTCKTRDSRSDSISSCDTTSTFISFNSKKRPSKVSLLLSKLEDSLDKESKDLICEDYQHNDFFEEICLDDRVSFDIVTKYVSVKINYEINVGKSNHLFTHEFSFPIELNISEVIRQGVECFNEQNHEINDLNDSIYRISFIGSDHSQYECKPSKKNGKAKLDVPSFSRDTTLGNTMTDTFSLLFAEQCLIAIRV